MTHRLRAIAAATVFAFFTFASISHARAEPLGGTWTKRYQTIKGNWQIVTTDDGRFLELDGKFKTRGAPDLKLFLSPRSADDVNANNALAGSVLIAPLTRAKGAQRYRLPANLDLASFNTLVLQCEQFTKLWGVSPLRGDQPSVKKDAAIE